MSFIPRFRLAGPAPLRRIALPALTLLLAAASTAVALPGRPPVGPLVRVEARGYDVSFRILLNARPPFQSEPVEFERQGRSPTFVNRPTDRDFAVESGTFFMPVPVISTWHRTEIESLDAGIVVEDGPLAGERPRLRDGRPHGVQRLEIPVAPFTGQTLRLFYTQRSTVWSSRIDDAAAMQLAWPESYPEDVVEALRPSPSIPSDDPLFTGWVTELFGADVTGVAPYAAAKRIAGSMVDRFRLTQPREYRGIAGGIDGLNASDALSAARRGEGSPADLVMITVATMRAAGIPARPVLGVTASADDEDRLRDRESLVVWAEFYLEGAGWVPFDPERLTGTGSWRNTPFDRGWPDFGTWDELNERIPMAYEFFPGPDAPPAQRPAIYGVRLEGPREVVPSQSITLGITSLGRR